MAFQVSGRHVGYILNKSENATPELLPFICKLTQASKATSCHTKGCDSLSYLSKGRYDETFAGEDGKANESVSKCSTTGLCIK